MNPVCSSTLFVGDVEVPNYLTRFPNKERVKCRVGP